MVSILLNRILFRNKLQNTYVKYNFEIKYKYKYKSNFVLK